MVSVDAEGLEPSSHTHNPIITRNGMALGRKGEFYTGGSVLCIFVELVTLARLCRRIEFQ